jgi:hypothetical protein
MGDLPRRHTRPTLSPLIVKLERALAVERNVARLYDQSCGAVIRQIFVAIQSLVDKNYHGSGHGNR